MPAMGFAVAAETCFEVHRAPTGIAGGGGSGAAHRVLDQRMATESISDGICQSADSAPWVKPPGGITQYQAVDTPRGCECQDSRCALIQILCTPQGQGSGINEPRV